MRIFAGRFHARSLLLATAAMVVSIWAFGLIANSASAQGGPDHSDLEHHHGFTGPGDVADWPPRPTGADGAMHSAESLGIVAFAAPGPAALRTADSAPTLSPELAEALGDDWLLISSVEGKAGKDGSLPAEDTYFSRSTNQTVIVLDGVQVLTFAPQELQPVISSEETSEAADLGRAWLVEQGHDAVNLEGFGIRALDAGELYPVRMVYVTFATSWFDDPLYRALVDLANGVVVDGGAL